MWSGSIATFEMEKWQCGWTLCPGRLAITYTTSLVLQPACWISRSWTHQPNSYYLPSCCRITPLRGGGFVSLHRSFSYILYREYLWISSSPGTRGESMICHGREGGNSRNSVEACMPFTVRRDTRCAYDGIREREGYRSVATRTIVLLDHKNASTKTECVKMPYE